MSFLQITICDIIEIIKGSDHMSSHQAAYAAAIRHAVNVQARSLETNDQRRDRAFNSRFAKSMRKKNVEQTNSVKDDWEFIYNQNKLKVTFLILAYMFSQDDGIIDKRENKAIQKILKDQSRYLTNQTINEIDIIISNNPTREYCLDYFDNNDVKSKLFKDSIQVIMKRLKWNDTYRKLLSELKIYFE